MGGGVVLRYLWNIEALGLGRASFVGTVFFADIEGVCAKDDDRADEDGGEQGFVVEDKADHCDEGEAQEFERGDDAGGRDF